MATHKTILRKTDTGIDFLGYYIKPTHTLVRRKVVKRFKDKFFEVLHVDGFVGVSDIPMIKSYVGHYVSVKCLHDMFRGDFGKFFCVWV